ncbi:Replication protein A DNA-binding subunit [Senna tora]|uniref:Replication protein A DNA-binding subunit n=1 Tax=Senna tora TaxID=362788 RepID=A0A834XGK5_9FABA|nr:Replication protein A DNA-binding subunit [Senna tora]
MGEFRPAKHNYTINFNGATGVQPCESATIPLYAFDFVPIANILQKKNDEDPSPSLRAKGLTSQQGLRPGKWRALGSGEGPQIKKFGRRHRGDHHRNFHRTT